MRGAKRESKGQQVKSFKHWVPQPSGPALPEIIKVYFSADEGVFNIYMPAHIGDLMGSSDWSNYPRGGHHEAWIPRHGEGELARCRHAIMARVIECFEGACKQYEFKLRNMAKEKVIKITVQANADGMGRYSWDSERFSLRLDDISFCGSPALHFTYQVCWRVDGRLFRDKDGMISGSDIGGVPEARAPGAARKEFIIDWTEEREAVVRSIEGGLQTLIERICELLADDLPKRLDAIAASGGFAALPAPDGTQ